MEILKKEFSYLYEAYRTGKKVELEPLIIQYKDFAEAHNKQINHPTQNQNSRLFWKKIIERGIPSIQLPKDFKPKGNENERKGAGYQCMLGKETTLKLKKITVDYQTSLFMVLFSLYILMLSRFSNQKHIACSVINAGRNHDSVYNIAGFFVNSVPFAIQVNYEVSFDIFLQEVNSKMIDIFQHQSYPLELVFAELNMRYPDIPVSFNMINIRDSMQREIEAPTAAESHHIADTQDVKFELEPYITEYKNSIHFHWAYNQSLFKPATIEYMAQEYFNMVHFFTRDIHNSYNDYKNSTQEHKHTFKR